MRTLVIIPAINEEYSIGKVIAAIPGNYVSEIVVVNNGSTDNTSEVARLAGATVIGEPRKGYGRACLAGMAYSTSLPASSRPDIIAFIDGDFSDFPEELPLLIDPILSGKFDFVIGSRVMGKNEKGALTPQQKTGNWLATRLIRLFFRVKYSDLGPFRAILFEKLLELNMRDKTYGWTVEMQVKAAKKKFRCLEIPVSYRKRIGQSKISGTISGSFKAGYKILTTIFRYLLKK